MPWTQGPSRRSSTCFSFDADSVVSTGFGGLRTALQQMQRYLVDAYDGTLASCCC